MPQWTAQALGATLQVALVSMQAWASNLTVFWSLKVVAWVLEMSEVLALVQEKFALRAVST